MMRKILIIFVVVVGTSGAKFKSNNEIKSWQRFCVIYSSLDGSNLQFAKFKLPDANWPCNMNQN